MGTLEGAKMIEKTVNQKIDVNTLSYIFVSILRMLDFLWGIASALFVYWLQHGSLDLQTIYAIIILSFSLITIYWFTAAGVYIFNPDQQLLTSIKVVFSNWIKVNLFLGAIILFTNTHREVSRFWIIGWFFLGLFGFTILRIIFHYIKQNYYRESKFVTRVVVVGAEYTGRWVIQHLREAGEKLIQVVGV